MLLMFKWNASNELKDALIGEGPGLGCVCMHISNNNTLYDANLSILTKHFKPRRHQMLTA